MIGDPGGKISDSRRFGTEDSAQESVPRVIRQEGGGFRYGIYCCRNQIQRTV